MTTTTHCAVCDNCHAALDADTPYQLDLAMMEANWHTTKSGDDYCPKCYTIDENGNLIIGLKLK